MAQLHSVSLVSQHTSSLFAGFPASHKVTCQAKNPDSVPRKVLGRDKIGRQNAIPENSVPLVARLTPVAIRICKILTFARNAFKDNSPKKSPQLKPAAATITADAATAIDPSLQKLETGFKKFKEYYNQEKALFKELSEGQSPPFMIIACADSRVDPCKILDLGFGEAFVVRNVANMVPAYNADSCSSAASAIEYAVLHLKVKHLMVCGHSRCGGIKALMGMKDDGSNRFSEFIEDWVLVGKGASGKVKRIRSNVSFDEQCAHCEKEAVNHSLWNLLSFPFVRDKVESGELALHGAYYDFVKGSFERWQLGTAMVVEHVKYE